MKKDEEENDGEEEAIARMGKGALKASGFDLV